MKKALLFLSLLISSQLIYAQENVLSVQAEISVLTIAPGNSLNDAFGHNAFRIKDRLRSIDVIFDYGRFDFDTPNFYLKFAQGKLNYSIGNSPYSAFFEHYIAQNRTVEEQVLNLNQEEKQSLFDFLINNYKPENRHYLYDFFYDNCATRIKDVIEDSSHDNLMFTNPDDFQPKTFRRLIYEHVDKNSWGSFGIDVALGSVIDKMATSEEHMFLPKYIHYFFENASFIDSEKPLVKQSRVLYKKVEKPTKSSFITSPLMIFSLIGLIILFVTYKDYKKDEWSKWLDVILFVGTGLIGIIILLLWFGTDHSTTANNYNLLWAFPINLFVFGQLLNPIVKKWFIKYLKFLVVMLALLTLHWLMGVQVFAIGLIPLLIAILVRYLFLIKYNSKKAS